MLHFFDHKDVSQYLIFYYPQYSVYSSSSSFSVLYLIAIVHILHINPIIISLIVNSTKTDSSHT